MYLLPSPKGDGNKGDSNKGDGNKDDNNKFNFFNFKSRIIIEKDKTRTNFLQEKFAYLHSISKHNEQRNRTR